MQPSHRNAFIENVLILRCSCGKKKTCPTSEELVLISFFFTASDYYENYAMIQYGTSVRLTGPSESVSEGIRLLFTSLLNDCHKNPTTRILAQYDF